MYHRTLGHLSLPVSSTLSHHPSVFNYTSFFVSWTYQAYPSPGTLALAIPSLHFLSSILCIAGFFSSMLPLKKPVPLPNLTLSHLHTNTVML